MDIATQVEKLELSRKIRRKTGKAISDFGLISDGDSIMVGISGGKDSMVLLMVLADLRRRSPISFDLKACTIDITNGNWQVNEITALCDSLSVPYKVISHPFIDIIESRDERSPCSFCANMRRGMLNSAAKEWGCNKVALGHNLDDVAETVLMNIFRTGRFSCFKPKLWQDRSEMWSIRPLIYVEEGLLEYESRRLGLPLLKYVCPFSVETERSRTKKLVADLRDKIPEIKQNILHALMNCREDDMWNSP